MLPLIIGHRGASAVAPENTLAAFERAMRDGADGVEFDVRLTSDGIPVVIHDATLQRTGLIGGIVAELTAEKLREIDVGSWFNRSLRGTAGEFGSEKLPTLDQVFGLFSHNGGLLYLEMKSAKANGTSLAAAVLRIIRKHAMGSRVILESFDLSLLKEVKTIENKIRTAALFEPRVYPPLSIVRRTNLVDLAKACGADEIALHHTLASRDVIATAMQAELGVVVWTVDDPGWIGRARSLGVGALITNNPATMLHHRHPGAMV